MQNGIYLPDDDADFPDVVAVTHNADERREHAETQNNEHDELGEGNAALNVERNRCGQYCQKHGGKHRHCNGKENLALFHPVDGRMCGLMCGVGELFIRIGRLIERLDDLDAVDIFHGDGVEVLARAHIPPELLFVADHHAHIHQKSHGDGDERNQPHPPVDGHYVNEQRNGRKQFGRHFGNDVRERRFNAVDTLQNGVLDLAARPRKNVAERHAREFVAGVRAHIGDDGERRLVRNGRGNHVAGVMPHPAQRGDQQPHTVSSERERKLARDEQFRDLAEAHERNNAESDFKHRKQHRQQIPAAIRARPFVQVRERTPLLYFICHKSSYILVRLCELLCMS